MKEQGVQTLKHGFQGFRLPLGVEAIKDRFFEDGGIDA
jgi:hypothetical protein